MNAIKTSDLETLAQAKPYIRVILAFISHIRYGYQHSGATVADYHFTNADIFIQQLEDDLKGK